MEKRYDVAALGELLIDFTRSGVSPQGNPLWDSLDDAREQVLSGLLRFANAAAAIITTRPGALRVMPKAQEIKALLELTKR